MQGFREADLIGGTAPGEHERETGHGVDLSVREARKVGSRHDGPRR